MDDCKWMKFKWVNSKGGGGGRRRRRRKRRRTTELRIITRTHTTECGGNKDSKVLGGGEPKLVLAESEPRIALSMGRKIIEIP